MKNTKVSGYTLYLLGLFLAVALFYGLVFLPFQQTADAAQRQHEADLYKIQDYNRQLPNLAQYRQSVAELEKEAEESGKMPGVASVKIGEELSAGLKKAGVTAKTVSVSDESEVSEAQKTSKGLTMKKVTASLTFACTEQQLRTLLHYYEQESSAVFVVGSLQMSTSGDSTTEITLEMDGYSYSEPSGIPAESNS